MVTAIPNESSTNGPDDDSSHARPEFTALLERLRSSAGMSTSELDSGRHALTGPWSPEPAEPEEPLIPEPIAAEVAWTVVESTREVPIDATAENLYERIRAEREQAATAQAARPSPEATADLVESIRRQAQAAIDEAFTAAGLADEAERMQGAVGALPLPRGRGADEAPASSALLGDLTSTDRTSTDRPDGDLTDGDRLAGDRATLRALGVPENWLRQLSGGDRYADVWRALAELPVPAIDPDAPVVAVVGTAEAALLEAHRIAVDLACPRRADGADGYGPRPVIEVPVGATVNLPTLVGRHPHCVVAIAADGTGDPSQVLESLGSIESPAVLVVMDAATSLAEARSWLFSLGRVDAIALDGFSEASRPAAMLQLGIPITRLDGIPIDRLTWTALLCAQLQAVDPA